MTTPPVNPEAPITRSEKECEGYRNFEAGILPEPRVETAEDVLRLIERDVPELLHLLMELMRSHTDGGTAPIHPRDRVVDEVLLESEFVLRSAARALRTGEWPRWRVTEQQSASLRTFCEGIRGNEEVSKDSLLDVLEQTATRLEAEKREGAR